MQSQVESGIELLARLNKRPSLRGLEDMLFFEGPRSTDVIEISGEQSSGKTLLLSQLLAKCILPNYREIRGCNASAVLINTKHHFQISKLVRLMKNIINAANTVSFTTDTVDMEFDETAVIKNSLRNLLVIDCYNSEQFALTLRMLDDIFVKRTKIALLAIDSITAHYWQNCQDNFITVDAYVKNLLQLVRTHTAQFNVATIYTKLYKSINNKKLTDDINYRIHLCKTCNTCTLKTTQTVKKIYYSILSNGIKWKMDEKEIPVKKENN
ncbi:DNA repair protein XRCC2 [Melipona quadrifasciata]|uniref:DNA repair protein XRCC2 n=1 Tax=Melipona quadrifasciata TaxID=166423 RepID=A0A0N0U2Y0_9HYME|nr:DNA repair protein XRCC2 [Melipona quadrifasciata]